MDPGRKQAFTDAWNIYKQFYDCRADDEYWGRLLAAEDEMIKRSDCPDFLQGLLWAVNEDIKRRVKG